MGKIIAFVLVAGSLASADVIPDPCKPTMRPGGPASADTAQIFNADLDFAQATAHRRLEGWMSYFADDAVVLHRKPIVGKDQIRAVYEKVFADSNFQLHWEPTNAEVFPSGDLGFTQGKFTAKDIDEKGQQLTQTGRYMTIWKKQPNGCWQIVFDTGSTDPPQPSNSEKRH